jgi:hypothetical protein
MNATNHSAHNEAITYMSFLGSAILLAVVGQIRRVNFVFHITQHELKSRYYGDHKATTNNAV